MKTILVLLFLFLVNVSAAPTRKEADCKDEYGHCPEWSKAGYCDKAGYKTYMTLMCAYSCDTCKELKQRKESEEDVTSASGLEDVQHENLTDIQETTERDEDGASANEPISGEGEIHGDSDDHEEKENQRVDKLQNEQSKDAAIESQRKMEQSTERQERQSMSEENEDKQEAANKQMQDRSMTATGDRDPPGVHVIKFQENDIDDDVNPRSKISTRPKENPAPNYKPLREIKVRSKEVTKKQDEDVSASGSIVEESGGVENPKASGESEEMRDIAGDIKTGSKIFEADISEPVEETSGCSSGYGCFSGNGEQAQLEKSEEAVELEPRSKIATPPQVTNTKIKQAVLNKNIGTAEVKKLPTRDSASGSDKEVKDDLQNNGEDKVPESDDIAGINSNTKSTTASETSEESLKAPKSDELASSGSGADVNDDIQGQHVHGDNDESIDSGKQAANSDALSGSGSGADTTQLKSDSSNEVQNAAKGEVQNQQVNEQGDKQDKTAKPEPVSEDKSVAIKSNDKNSDMNGQNENMKNTAANTISDQNQSAAKEETNTEKGDLIDNENSKSTKESEVKSDKGNEEEKQQQEDKTAKLESANEDHSTAKSDVNSEEVDAQKDVKGTAESKPDEPQKSDTENEEKHTEDDLTTDTTTPKPKDNQSEAKSDKGNKELDERQDVKTVETNDNRSGGEKEAEETNDTSSGSAAASIDTDHDIDADEDNPDESKTESKTTNTQASDAEENEMEDAIKEDMLNEMKGSGAGSGQGKDSNEDLASPAARKKITSMEQLIKDDKPKAEKAKDVPAKTRENVPSAEETPDDYINTDLGKGQKVRLILDQHYYKPYSNEDSMAYEMLALDLKKEVERAVGNQAIVSQISFSEIQKPGKLPRYSRVLATFMLHGDINALQDSVRKGVVGDLMVDKKFFRSS